MRAVDHGQIHEMLYHKPRNRKTFSVFDSESKEENTEEQNPKLKATQN